MRTHTIAIAIAGLSFTVAAAAQDKQTQIFAASGPWAMEYAEDSCRLVRNFTDGQDEITLALQRFVSNDEITIGIAGDSIKAYRRAKETSVSFVPGGSKNQSRALFRSALADGTAAFLVPDATLRQPTDWSKLSDDERKRIAATPTSREEEVELAKNVTAIRLDNGFVKIVELQTGSLAEPIKAMHACIDDLLRHWGLDPEVQRTLSRLAVPANGRDMVRSFNFPLEPLMMGQGGSVRIRLMVSAEGQATECKITGPSGPKEFIDASCRALMAEAWFDPALDAEGNPVESYQANTVIFGIR